jgi:hypothetical protein
LPQKNWEAAMLVLLMERIYDVCHWDGFIQNDILNQVSWRLVQAFRQYCFASAIWKAFGNLPQC